MKCILTYVIQPHVVALIYVAMANTVLVLFHSSIFITRDNHTLIGREIFEAVLFLCFIIGTYMSACSLYMLILIVCT